MSEWNADMDAAPRDESEILSGRFRQGEVPEYAVISFSWEDEHGKPAWMANHQFRFFPTHWMPLPPPPEGET